MGTLYVYQVVGPLSFCQHIQVVQIHKDSHICLYPQLEEDREVQTQVCCVYSHQDAAGISFGSRKIYWFIILANGDVICSEFSFLNTVKFDLVKRYY